jgi:hypothetical protein
MKNEEAAKPAPALAFTAFVSFATTLLRARVMHGARPCADACATLFRDAAKRRNG